MIAGSRKVALTCGSLGPQKVRVGGDLVLWVGLQHGVGRAAVQQGHLTLSDEGWGLVEWDSGRGGCRWQKAGGCGGGRKGTT